MSDNVIPIVRHAPSRAGLRESFFEVNDQIVHWLTRLRDAAEHGAVGSFLQRSRGKGNLADIDPVDFAYGNHVPSRQKEAGFDAALSKGYHHYGGRISSAAFGDYGEPFVLTSAQP